MFCNHCGSHIHENARFCTACGTEQIRDSQHNHNPQPPVYDTKRNGIEKKRNKRNLTTGILLSILLIVLGISQLTLTITGRTARGYVTGYKQDSRGSYESLPNPNQYNITYEFTVNGKRYTGSTTKIYKHGIVARQDGTRETIVVRYLPFYPGINSEDNNKVSLLGFLLAGSGILLLVMMRRQRQKKGR